MATWNDPCPQCGAELYCAHRPDPNGAGRGVLTAIDGGRADDDVRYRATRMTSVHGRQLVAEWVRGTVHGKMIACPMRSLAVEGEAWTSGQWTEAAWITYLVWDDGQDPTDGGLLERHYDRVLDRVMWHPVGSASVTSNLAEAISLVLSITDARTWEA